MEGIQKQEPEFVCQKDRLNWIGRFPDCALEETMDEILALIDPSDEVHF